MIEISTFEFKLYQYPLPFACGNLTFGFAVRETWLNCFNEVTQFACDHSEKKDNALFVNWLMS